MVKDRAQMPRIINLIKHFFINCSSMQVKIRYEKEKRNKKMQMSCFDYSEYTRTDLHDKVRVIKICKEEMALMVPSENINGSLRIRSHGYLPVNGGFQGSQTNNVSNHHLGATDDHTFHHLRFSICLASSLAIDAKFSAPLCNSAVRSSSLCYE